jgi:hypothetical protein
MLFAGDLEDDLIEVPLVARPGQPPADDVGELLAEITAYRRCPFGPRPHWRIVSWLTSMPRKASISSTIRRLRGKRKYSQTV